MILDLVHAHCRRDKLGSTVRRARRARPTKEDKTEYEDEDVDGDEDE